MKNRVLAGVLAVLAVGCVTVMRGDPIVERSGSNQGVIILTSQMSFGVTWTQSFDATNVSISADLWALGGPSKTGRAYLTTSIGPGTTIADQIAFTSFVFPASASDLVLFNGLNLEAGTYFLSLVGDSSTSGAGWVVSPVGAAVQVAPGASFGTAYGFGYSPPAFLPEGTFTENTDLTTWVDFRVTGDIASVPDSASSGMLVASAFGLLLVTRKRR